MIKTAPKYAEYSSLPILKSCHLENRDTSHLTEKYRNEEAVNLKT